jgi:phosphohistidine phosphatase
MPTLSLLRHAKAAQAVAGQGDFDRALTERGRRDADRMSHLVARMTPDLALVSSAARTRETWEIVARALDPAPTVFVERELYLCRAEAVISRLQELPDDFASVVVVGHNPCMQEVALWLGEGDSGRAMTDIRTKFPTAALAIFDIQPGWSSLGPKRARLERFVTPRELD